MLLATELFSNEFRVSLLGRKNLITKVSPGKRIKCFPSTLRWRNLKTQQSSVILDLCLRKTRSGKSRDYRDVIVLEKLRFQIVFRSHGNRLKAGVFKSSGLKNLFEKLRFRDGSVLMVNLTAEKRCVFKFLRRSVRRGLTMNIFIFTSSSDPSSVLKPCSPTAILD